MQDIKLYGRSDESDSGENPKSSITPRGGWCIGNGQVAQTKLYDKCICLNCMHDPITVLVKKNDKV